MAGCFLMKTRIQLLSKHKNYIIYLILMHKHASVVHHEEMQTASLGKASVVAMDILVF